MYTSLRFDSTDGQSEGWLPLCSQCSSTEVHLTSTKEKHELHSLPRSKDALQSVCMVWQYVRTCTCFPPTLQRPATSIGKFKTARDRLFGVKLRGRSQRKNHETHALILSFFYSRVRQRYAPNVFAAASICAIIYSKSTLISERIFALDVLSYCQQ